MAIEIYQKAPNKLLTVVTSSDGSVTYQGYNGKIGWIKTPNLQREMTSAELAQVRQQADLYKDLNLKNLFSTLKVVAKQKVNERDAYFVEGVNSSGKTEKLFFDAEVGLLVRRVVLNKTILGLDPVQTDFLDYLESSHGEVLKDIRTKKALDDGITRRLVGALEAFQKLFVPGE